MATLPDSPHGEECSQYAAQSHKDGGDEQDVKGVLQKGNRKRRHCCKEVSSLRSVQSLRSRLQKGTEREMERRGHKLKAWYLICSSGCGCDEVPKCAAEQDVEGAFQK